MKARSNTGPIGLFLSALMAGLLGGVGGAGAFPATDYVPLAPGDTWTYLEDGAVQSVDTVLSATGFENGMMTAIVETSGGAFDGLRRDMTVGPSGFQIHKVDLPDVVATLAPAYAILNADFMVGDEIMNAGTATVTQTGMAPVMQAYSGTARVDRTEQVQVPLGTFDAFVVLTSLFAAQAQTDNVWLVAGLGVVREVRSNNGPFVTRELVSTSLPEPGSASLALGVVSSLFAIRAMIARAQGA